MAHELLDKVASTTIRAIRGEKLARWTSYGVDVAWKKITYFFDILSGVPLHDSYQTVENDRPSVAQARKFRRKFILPRRRLEKAKDGRLQWKRLAPGEHIHNSRKYHECDVPLASLTEFGEGWLLYFWTLKLVGLVSLLSTFVMIISWYDIYRRNGPASSREGSGGLLDWMFSQFSSAVCEDATIVCLDTSCDLTAKKYICPAPSLMNAIPCMTVQAIFTLYIVSLRRSHSGTSQYVKSLQGDNGLRPEDYALVVENPPEDASDPDEWKNYFEQFGEVAAITIAKADGPLVWKCLEPRQLTVLLYRDDPEASAEHIKIAEEAPVSVRKRSSSVHSARSFSVVTEGDIILKQKKNEACQNIEGFTDIGDSDTEEEPGSTVSTFAPWYTGERLRTRKKMSQLAEELSAEENQKLDNGNVDGNDQRIEGVRLAALMDPFERYKSPYLIFRWLRFELKRSLPHYFGTFSKTDREMILHRLLRECPKELQDEVTELEQGKVFPPVRVFVIFESLAARRECLASLTRGGILTSFFGQHRNELHSRLAFRGEKTIIVTEPPAPEQIIWWNLDASPWRRIKDDFFSLFITLLLITIALFAAIAFSNHAIDEREGPQYFRCFLFACWAQIYNQICTQTFGWLSSQEHHHDLDAQQLSLLLRYTLLKCVTTISYVLTTPREEFLTLRNIVGMKTMLWADAIVGPLMRYLDFFDGFRRSLSRFLPNQVLMNWAHLSPAHDIADSYSNIVKTVFIGLFTLPVIPSSLLFTSVGCCIAYWVDKQSLLRVWSCHTHSKPAKWVAWSFQNLLGFAVVITMMETVQVYKNWPFDDLCWQTELHVLNISSHHSNYVWKKTDKSTSLAAYFHDLFSVWATTPCDMDSNHQRALRVYSIGCITITIFIFIFFLGRNIWNLSYRLFYTKVITPKENENRLPLFSDFNQATAYLPQVKDPSFMFPLLSTDMSFVNKNHIPWVCDYSAMNLAEDLDGMTKDEGLMGRFSAVKYFDDKKVRQR